MGSRRTHEQAAVAAARAAYLAGFAGTSNLEAQRRYGVPALGTSAHAFTLLHTTARRPRRAGGVPGAGRRRSASAPRCSSTPTTSPQGVANAVAVAGPDLGAVRIDSGDLGVLARQVRAQLDGLGATRTRIVVSGDLDEFAIAALRAEPVDIYGVGTSLVTGSGAPTAGMVYKLVEVDGIPVEKRSSHKESHGGRKEAHAVGQAVGHHRRRDRPPAGEPPPEADLVARPLAVPLVRAGEPVADLEPGRGPRARRRRAAQPAVGRAEAVPRRARHPDPDGPARRPRRRRRSHVRRSSVTELLAAAVAALGGTERSGQIEMAEAVEHAFDTGEHLAVQAGTGTGKSLAYLVPAIARAVDHDEPVVVSTATIALQRQLVDRDLPRLADALAGALPRRPRFALLKGRGNYLCLNKIHNGVGGRAGRPTAGGAVRRRSPPPRWAATCSGSPHGRRTPRPVTATSWRPACRTGRGARSACRRGSASARRAARSAPTASRRRPAARPAHADVVVTNHALLAIDAIADAPCCPNTSCSSSTRRTNCRPGDQRGDRRTVGDRARRRRPRRVARLVEPELAQRFEAATATFASAIHDATPGRMDRLDDEMATYLTALRDAADKVRSAIDTAPSDPKAAAARSEAVTALNDISDTATRILSSFGPAIPDRTDVVWLDHEDNRGSIRAVLRVAPLSVADLLRGRLFEQSTVVLTSATLTVGGTFDAMAAVLGFDGGDDDERRRGAASTSARRSSTPSPASSTSPPTCRRPAATAPGPPSNSTRSRA